MLAVAAALAVLTAWQVLAIKRGDVGSAADWMAAIATVSAVIVSLWLSQQSRREREAELKQARLEIEAAYETVLLDSYAAMVGVWETVKDHVHFRGSWSPRPGVRELASCEKAVNVFLKRHCLPSQYASLAKMTILLGNAISLMQSQMLPGRQSAERLFFPLLVSMHTVVADLKGAPPAPTLSGLPAPDPSAF